MFLFRTHFSSYLIAFASSTLTGRVDLEGYRYLLLKFPRIGLGVDVDSLDKVDFCCFSLLIIFLVISYVYDKPEH